MGERAEQRLILEMISSGRITPAEGLELLQALGEEPLVEQDESWEELEAAPDMPDAAGVSSAGPAAPDSPPAAPLTPDTYPGQARPDIPDFDTWIPEIVQIQRL